MKIFQLLKIIFSLLTIICSTTVFGAHKSKIIKSGPGEIVFKLTLDTVFVNSSAISIKPNLDFNKTPGEFVLPLDIIPLVGLPEDIEISFERSQPIELKNFSPKTNRNEIVSNSPLEKKQGTQYTHKVIRNDIYIEKSIQINGEYIYLLYINDLETTIKDSTASSFADDTRISRQIELTQDTEKLQFDLNNVIEWSKSNNMELHEQKFESRTRIRVPDPKSGPRPDDGSRTRFQALRSTNFVPLKQSKAFLSRNSL